MSSLFWCATWALLSGAGTGVDAPAVAGEAAASRGARDPAASPVVAEPELAPPPREPWRLEGTVGLGVDSNAARANGSDVAGALNGAVVAAGEPLRGLTLVAGASALVRTTNLPVEANGTLHAVWQEGLSRDLTLALGSLTRLDRSYVVFVEGARLRQGRARYEIGESLDAALRARFGVIDAEVGGSLDLADVEGAESYGLVSAGPRASVRFIPSAVFAARLAYGFDVRNLARLPDVSPTGDLIPRAGGRRLDLHRARLTLRVQVGDFTGRLRVDGELIRDDAAGSLAGSRQDGRLDTRVQFTEDLALDAGVGLAMRRYSERASTPAVGDLETYVVGQLGFETWISRHLGMSVRYQVEHASLAPTTFAWTRHLVLVGPATRIRFGEGDR